MRFAPNCLPLPYVPVLFPGELLSSWLRRIGMEYGVTFEQLALHFGLSRTKPIDVDLALATTDVKRLAVALRSSPAEIRQSMHQPLRLPARALRADRTPTPTRC